MNTESKKPRDDIKCLSLGTTAYSMAKELAHNSCLSVSAFLRQLIAKNYHSYKQKINSSSS